MMPLTDLFVHTYVLVDDALKCGAVPVPRRPGPAPACADAEVLTVALVRHLLALASAPSWPRCAASGGTTSPRCPHRASSTAGSGGSGRPSSCCAST
jgi:hypothetical protein